MTDCWRCRDCKHWRAGTLDEGEYALSEAEYGLMYTPDYPLPVITMPDFGCVQFEGREDSNGD